MWNADSQGLTRSHPQYVWGMSEAAAQKTELYFYSIPGTFSMMQKQRLHAISQYSCSVYDYTLPYFWFLFGGKRSLT